MKILLAIISFLFILSFQSNAQGCVAIRSAGGMCMATHTGDTHSDSKWSLNVNNRYFKSYKHFRGEHEEKQRVENKTEVINHTNTVDLTVNRNLNSSWSLSFALPVI